MRTTARFSILIFGSLLVVLTSGCSDWKDGGTHVATVRDVSVPAQVQPTESLTITFSADLTQPTGRPRFSHLETTRTEHSLLITVWADVDLWRGSGPMPPTDLTVLENYRYVEAAPFSDGPFEVEFSQPFGDPLVVTVSVGGPEAS